MSYLLEHDGAYPRHLLRMDDSQLRPTQKEEKIVKRLGRDEAIVSPIYTDSGGSYY